MSDLDGTLEHIAKIDLDGIRREVKQLCAIRDWALQQQPIKAGDRVRIVTEFDFGKAWGWGQYREALAPGAVGTATSVDYYETNGKWYVDVVLDRLWSVSDYAGKVERYWKGRADETPEGYVKPTAFDQERRPEGKRAIFAVPLHKLRPASEVWP